MESVEKKVFDALAQEQFIVTLGGKEFEFRPMSLSDRQEISVISESIGGAFATKETNDDSEQYVFKDAIAAGKYARQIAEIISIGAHIRGWRFRYKNLKRFRFFQSEKARRREVFNYAYYHADIQEVYDAIIQIFAKGRPAFFLDITTTLCLQNQLKPTKETAATAHGQSKPE